MIVYVLSVGATSIELAAFHRYDYAKNSKFFVCMNIALFKPKQSNERFDECTELL